VVTSEIGHWTRNLGARLSPARDCAVREHHRGLVRGTEQQGLRCYGPTRSGAIEHDQSPASGADQAPKNLKEQDRQGYIKQNTTRGYQQNR
jgi:hypothetical protein